MHPQAAHLAKTPPRTYVPDDLDERVAELAEILAVGLLRLRALESSRNSRDLREFPLDFAARPSVHGRPKRSTGDGG